MISVRQWTISALGLLTIVTFCTYQLLNVQIPRSMERAEWVRFVSTQIPGGGSPGASTSLWSLLMGIQGVQLMFGIPFLHVTQITMGFLLHPGLGFASCAALECFVIYGFLLIQAHTVDMLAEEAQRALPMVNERRAKRLWFAFCMLMSSLPVYMSVITVHVGIVRRHEFALLAVLVSVLSVSKNVVLGALLRAGGHALACTVLGLVVFVSPIVFTLVTVYMSSLAKAHGPPGAGDALELEEVRSLAGTCTSEPSAFEQYDAYVLEQAEDETLAERIDEILNPEPGDSEPSPRAGVRDADADADAGGGGGDARS
jgi:hypothetical protein